MSFNYEYSDTEPVEEPYPEREQPRLELVDGIFSEANMVEATDNAERLAESAAEPADSGSDEPAEETATEARTKAEIQLERYQRIARKRIPDLLQGIIETEFEPRRRSGYRIGGEEGRKGNRRGL